MISFFGLVSVGFDFWILLSGIIRLSVMMNNYALTGIIICMEDIIIVKVDAATAVITMSSFLKDG